MKSDYSPFSVALIDVFASALAVFMIFSFISLPFITNTSKEDSTLVDNSAINESSQDVASLQQALQEAQSALSKIKRVQSQNFRMNLPIVFDGNQWYLRPESIDIIKMMGREISVNGVDVEIIGHTASRYDPDDKKRRCYQLDNAGDVSASARVTAIAPIQPSFKRCFIGQEWNDFLSAKRAEVIRDYLVSNFDIQPERLYARGVGSREPLKDVSADDSRNRRVQIQYEVK